MTQVKHASGQLMKSSSKGWPDFQVPLLVGKGVLNLLQYFLYQTHLALDTEVEVKVTNMEIGSITQKA